MLQGYKDGGWLPRSILRRNRVVLKGIASKQNFGTFKLEYCVLVCFDPFICPTQDWADSKILQASFGSLRCHFVKEVRLSPVPVDEENRLSGTLLASMRVSVLVALPGYVVQFMLVFRYIRTQNFPIIAAIFKSNFAA